MDGWMDEAMKEKDFKVLMFVNGQALAGLFAERNAPGCLPSPQQLSVSGFCDVA